MRWLKRKLRNWLMENNSRDANSMSPAYVDYVDARSRPASDPTMHFRVFNASGGKLVEFRSEHVSKSNSISEDYQMYIIREDEDFGDAIKKIAMLHLMRTGG